MISSPHLPFQDYAAGLQQGLAQIGLGLDSMQQTQLLEYLALLSKWNRVYNLTAIREPKEMLSRHLLDTLAVIPLIKKEIQQNSREYSGEMVTTTKSAINADNTSQPRYSLRILDVGSGGGLPGIPWALACPDWHLTLIDVVQKKTTFLSQVKIQLGIENVEVVTGRVEALADPTPFSCFNIITSRAFSDLRQFIQLAGRYLAPNGTAIALKGVYPVDELSALPTTWRAEQVLPLKVPGLSNTQRHIVFLKPTNK